MNTSLKQKTITGIFWSAIEKVGFLGIQFLITIIVARILTPSDYGMIGMLTIFTALATIIIDSGFGQSLIRRSEITQVECSTIFYFNIFVSIVIYLLLFIASPYIAKYFNTPQLEKIAKYTFLIFPINALGLIHNTILTKNVKFRLLAKISTISASIAGIVSIILAYLGFQVWALVYQSIIYYLTRLLLLWRYSPWKPSTKISISAIKEDMIFGSNLLGTNAIAVIFNNIYSLIIGKYYSIGEVGFYNQAKRIEEIPQYTFIAIVQRVSYPILAEIQNDNKRLKDAYRRIINQTMYIHLPIMFCLLPLSENLIKILLSEKWMPTVPYFQLLCIYGVLTPLHSININILKIKGKSRSIFYLEIVQKVFICVMIILTIKHGVLILLTGQIVASVFSVFINMYYCGREIDLNIYEQIGDIIPYLLLSIITSVFMWSVTYSKILENATLLLVIMQIIVGLVIFLSLSQIFNVQAFNEIIQIAKVKFVNKKYYSV